MKINFYFLILALLCISGLSETFGQTRYDEFPTTIPRNADIRKKNDSEGKGGAQTNFVPIGTSWPNRIISYAFQNGTADIAGDDERQAVRDAFAIWAAQTELAFIEVCDVNNANIVFL